MVIQLFSVMAAIQLASSAVINSCMSPVYYRTLEMQDAFQTLFTSKVSMST